MIQLINVDKNYLNGKWPKRQNNSYKGSYGHILVIAGNSQYGGAGILASSAAVYSGGGLVTLATDPSNFTAVHSTTAEVMLINFMDFSELGNALKTATIVVIGPGLGLAAESLRILRYVLEKINPVVPLIIDGSAIDLIADNQIKITHPKAIFTPHQMEWQRLSGIKISNQLPVANQAMVDQLDSIVILKHFQTEIYHPHGERQKIIAGNPGMATGGSGDVLTGILAALIAQSDSLSLGITLGTFLHSFVADQIYETESVVLPHRLIQQVPKILKDLQ
ncbi:NAD(P)H-hydrate dehydratase [Pediococcus stilesii]|uniref:ADP-dependent (S)-NAD(P)H-hydrate dehydratase n=1 Tax=Pediococcus stilesii TaxID=331679 RepID=A0A0R2KYI6_9LACO|nr:NAD(P)H-hydrate dehydratase [Pediococcus stilesii]KRN94603.1 sugar kinase [Pediococcus stilesii]